TTYFTAANGTRIGQAITVLTDGKYRRDWITNPSFAPTDAIQYFGLKWQILRYADVLLMYAEAENELNGPTASAYNAINMVRRRGFGKPINTPDATVDIPAGLSKADFFKYIVRERSLELAGEGVRKYDLIRWNLLGTAIAESRANMNRMATVTAMVNPTYMAGYPSYCLTNTLPIRMYVNTGTTSDNYNIGFMYRNSLYKTAPTSTPSGTTSVNWLTSAINAAGTNSPVGRFATGFTTGKGELLPIPQPARDANRNLSQNPGY
ncbi:MAG: RagB/SusD family nutrient uptake outer membrane protein, partial [Chitinophagaceae bacterium]|nr:RagB/SusD family nutrient uptake outer membrane protein [Chitinophagaceae bacterium]